MKQACLAAILAAVSLVGSYRVAWTEPLLGAELLSDQQIAEMVVRESRSAYYSTGHPCACPEDRASNGSRCGGRSAWSKPGGANPLCYVSDVSQALIEKYRARLRGEARAH